MSPVFSFYKEFMLRRHTICFGKPKSECEELIEEWVFNSRDKEVVKQRFLEGHTYETIAEMNDMSVSTVKRIIYKCEALLLEHI